jgi:hydrogenase maturation protease
MTTTLVIGVGNYDRGDDAAGLAVAERIRAAHLPGVGVMELDGDQLGLLDAWANAAEVYVVDAVCSGSPPGTIYRFDAARPLSNRFRHRGTHTFSLADVVELARVLGTLPPRLTGYGIEGRTFEIGAALSPETSGAVQAVANLLLRDLQELPGLHEQDELRDGG